MEYILQTNQVSKTIGGKSLVSNIDLHVKKGEIYGFLGLNGAGKGTGSHGQCGKVYESCPQVHQL